MKYERGLKVKTQKSIAFRAVRIIVITAVAFAVVVYVHLRRQSAAPEVEPCCVHTHDDHGDDHE